MDRNIGWIIGAIGLMGGALAWYTRIVISEALYQFKEGLRKEFWDSALAAARVAPIEKDITELRAKLVAIDDYAHDSRHALNNEIQQLTLKVERMMVNR